MSRRPARFTEADIRRAVKVAGQATRPMTVEILPDGVIRIVPTIPRNDDAGHCEEEVIRL